MRRIFLIILLIILVPCGGGKDQAQPTDQTSTGELAFYDDFEADLIAILAKTDNTLRKVDSIKRDQVIAAIKDFAKALGINPDDAQTDENGRVFKKILIGEEVEWYFHYTPAGDPNLLQNELVVVRKTWTKEPGVEQPLSEQNAREIAEAEIQKYKIPFTDETDTLNYAATTQLRSVDGEETVNNNASVQSAVNYAEDTAPPKILRQTVGFYRKVKDRQVVNSAFQVDVDPAKKKAVGVSLRNWWGLSEEEAVTTKSLEELKDDIINTVKLNSSSNYDVDLANCGPTYYQRSDALIPTVTCVANPIIDLTVGDKMVRTDAPISVTVSLTPDYPADESDVGVTSVAVEEETDPLPPDYGDTAGARFGIYWADETRFYAGAVAFKDKFIEKWSDYDGPRHAYKNYFVGTYAYNYVDNADLVYVVAHGAIQGFAGWDEFVWVNHSSEPVAQLGLGDLEYMAHPACSMGSVIYCDGLSAVRRYTDTNVRDTVFAGLHIFSSNHGIEYSNIGRQRERGRTYAQYLIDGLSLIEAWDSAELDTNSWLSSSDYSDDCALVSDPDDGCSIDYRFACDRWTTYPASFYIDSKRNVTLNTRGDYTSDIRKGDAGYDVDMVYRYQTESIPIASSGHSLP